MSEMMSEETRFHWQGDQVVCVLSLAGTVIASSIPAVKFRHNDGNYHNNFGKYKTAQGTNKGKCLIRHWNRATNTWDTCGTELTWVICNLREHVKGVHEDYVPYKDLDPPYIDFISAAFSKKTGLWHRLNRLYLWLHQTTFSYPLRSRERRERQECC